MPAVCMGLRACAWVWAGRRRRDWAGPGVECSSGLGMNAYHHRRDRGHGGGNGLPLPQILQRSGWLLFALLLVEGYGELG